MELNWLKYFYEAATSLSITRTGEKLKVSQPAVSKMIKQLEASLGYPLFVRKHHSLQLTSEGQALYQVCLPVFRKLGEIPGLHSKLDRNTEGVIRLGASDTLSIYVLPKIIEQFQKKYPKVEWQLYSGTSREIKQKVLSGEIDYGMFYTALSLQEVKLFQEQILGAVEFRVVYSAKMKRMGSIEALNRSKLTYIGARYSDYATTAPEQWIYHKAGIHIGNVIQANSKEVQKQLVLQGTGFAILPHFMVEKELKEKKVYALKAPKRSAETQIRLIYRKGESPSRLVQAFIRSFSECGETILRLPESQ